MLFSGVTLALVPPDKHELVSTVAPDKADISLRCLCTNIYSGAGASDLLIEFGSFFTYFLLVYSLQNVTMKVLYSSVSWSSISFSKHI